MNKLIMQPAALSFVQETLADNAEIKRLAGLPAIEYDREREAAAARLGIRIKTLDVSVEDAREKNRKSDGGETTAQGRSIKFRETKPWPEAISGADLLAGIAGALRQYVILGETQADAVALWVLFTYAYDGFDTNPKLVAQSVQKRSGKSRLAEVLARLCCRTLMLSGITGAALLRVLSAEHPTVLIDEFDTMMKGDKEMAETLRGILNSGFNRSGARIIKNVPIAGGDYEPREFSTWCPQFLAGIGKLPDTVSDRSIIITMKRKLVTERVKRLRHRDGADLDELARKAAKWVADNMEKLNAATPDSPNGLHDRAADAWEPLLAIADLAGGDWPERARKAAVALSGESVAEDGDLGTKLLGDLHRLFASEASGVLFSSEIVEKLNEMDDRPWAEMPPRGKPITQNKLADILRDYRVRPESVRRGTEQKKGYQVWQFEDAFARYLPPTVPSSQEQENQAQTDVMSRPIDVGRDASNTADNADSIGTRDGGTVESSVQAEEMQWTR